MIVDFIAARLRKEFDGLQLLLATDYSKKDCYMHVFALDIDTLGQSFMQLKHEYPGMWETVYLGSGENVPDFVCDSKTKRKDK